jgi:spore germination protein GerM
VVDAGDNEQKVNSALDALLAGPDDRETRRRLTTSIPPDATAFAVLEGRRAVVEVDFGPAPVNSTLTAGQVALTTLSVPGVHSVVFTVDGVVTNVTLPSGKDSNGPVTAKDYK